MSNLSLVKSTFCVDLYKNFAETIKQIITILKKDQEVKWTTEAKNSFEKIKMALTEAPLLVSLDFTREFLTFSFAFEDTLAAVLL